MPSVDKIAFTIGGFAIHWYGILVAAGFGFGLWTASRRSLQHGRLPREAVADLGPWLVVGGLLGARLWFVIAYWEQEFANQPWREIFNVRAGGLVFYGGLLGAALVGGIFVRIRQWPLWELGDVLAPSLALGHAFGRVGCFINGCCYGLPTRLPWAVSNADQPLLLNTGVHPTQIYEALLLVALYAALAWQYRVKRFAGHTFALYLLAYAVVRFGVEFFRGDYGAQAIAGLKPGQAFSVLVFAAGLWLFASQSRTAPSKSPRPAQPKQPGQQP